MLHLTAGTYFHTLDRARDNYTQHVRARSTYEIAFRKTDTESANECVSMTDLRGNEYG